ncbi:MAG: sodium transporter [Lentisphaerae bacterium]|nr:sodium transporter [Lentisphaerota bacterium]
MQHLQGLDYAAIGIYIALMAVIGLSFGWFVKDIGGYFTGGSAIPWVMSAISNFMAWFSTFVFIAYAGIAHQHGLVAVTVYWSTVPACVLGAVVFAARWRRTGFTTPTEYLEVRYNLGLRQVVTWVGLLMRFLDNMVRLYAIAVFIAAATPLPLVPAIVVSGVIVTVFNIVGGVWSVVVMGTVQFVILVLSCLILVPLALGDAGGLAALRERIPEHMTWFNGPKGSLLWLSVFYFMIFVKVNENWTIIQRYACVRDEREAVKVGVWTGAVFLVSLPVFLLPAVASKVLLPDLPDPEMAYVALALKLLPAGVMGILFSSMFAATMSSLNADYNVMAGVLTNDVYKRLVNPAAPQARLMLVARVSTAVVGAIVIAGASFIRHFGGAFEANKLFTGILAIPIGVPLLLGILVRRPGPAAAGLSILAGVVAGIVLNGMPRVSWEAATLIETAICTAVYFAPLKRRSTPESAAAAGAFFERIGRPIPEAEKPAIGDDTKRALRKLFVFSFVVSGALFIGMSLPSIASTSGRLSCAAGGLCLLGAALLALPPRRKTRENA